MKIAKHFSLDELTFSQTAARAGIDNSPTPAALDNLVRLAGMLENIRFLLGVPVFVSSGYRCPALNNRVGGAPGSQHCHGLAADFTAPAFGSPLAIAEAISGTGMGFDQLIHEYGRWVHVSLPPGGAEPRRQRLTIDRLGTRTGLHPARDGGKEVA